MSQLTDRAYLRGDQYKDTRHLGARIDLHARFSTNPYGWQRWIFVTKDAGVLRARI